MRGMTVEEMLAEDAANDASGANFTDDHGAITDMKYIYHVQFAIPRFVEGCTEADIDSLRRRLNRIGNAVYVEGDLEQGLTTVHVHTNNPGDAIEYGLDLGECVDFCLENMAETRRRETGSAEEASPAEPAPDMPHKAYGMVAVSQGEGFAQIFRDLTVDAIVEGGQSMNPSTEDILKAIRLINADTVFVIPTKNVAMGIAAAVAYQPDADGEANAKAMAQAAENVKTATVTFAVRDSENNGVTIHEGDYIGLQNGQIACAGGDLNEVIRETMDAVMTGDDELITVYYGSDVAEDDAKKTADQIADAYPDCDVECLAGGQPLYYYLISVE